MDRSELPDLLKSTKIETINFFGLSNDELSKTYGDGKWSIRQILHHLTDSELIFQYRLKTIIAEPKQIIWAYNQDKWNAAFGYEFMPLGDKARVFELCKELNIALTDKYYEQYGAIKFVHSEAGIRTLAEEFARIASHNLSHLDQIRLALSK